MLAPFTSARDRATKDAMKPALLAKDDATCDFVQRVGRIREYVHVDLPELYKAFKAGDAILDHGPLQTPEYLEDRIGPYEFGDGRLSSGSEKLAKAITNEFGGKVDFVIIEKNGVYKLILGRAHSGLSGGRPSVFAAGELKFDRYGIVTGITNGSGHYLPGKDNLNRAFVFLRSHGMLIPQRPVSVEPQ